MATRVLPGAQRIIRPAHFRCRPSLAALRSGCGARRYASETIPLVQMKRSQPVAASKRSVQNRRELGDYEQSLELSTDNITNELPEYTEVVRRSPLPSLLKFLPKGPAPPSVTLSPASGRVGATTGPIQPVQDKADMEVESGDVAVSTAGLRKNPVGVQLLSSHMHRQLFPGEPLPQPPSALLSISKQHLADHGLSPEGAGAVPEISFDLPPLEGGNIREHFCNLGEAAAQPYLSTAKRFAESDLPPIPSRWETARPGWTRYGRDGSVTAVDNLGGEVAVSFDVEVLYRVSPYPVLATAASVDAWYSWLSPTIFEGPSGEAAVEPSASSESNPMLQKLIPLFPDKSEPAVVIGHNVCYDRARVLEEYALNDTPTRWLDTLSLHVATRGITSVQRPAWMAHKKNKLAKQTQQSETIEVLEQAALDRGDDELLASVMSWASSPDSEGAKPENTWEEVTSMNSLADVANLHCGIKMDKSVRNRFADESITHASQLRPQLDELLDYCATDVDTTHHVYKAVLPLFLTSCPHPASFAGALTMGSAFLPVDHNWKEYLQKADAKYHELHDEVCLALRHIAEKLRRQGPVEGDAWSQQLDWTPKAARWPDSAASGGKSTSSGGDKFGALQLEPSSSTPSAPDMLEGSEEEIPTWYSAMVAAEDIKAYGPAFESTILPLIMRISCRGYPVYRLQEHMWCFRAPLDAIGDLVEYHGAPVELSAKDAHLFEFLDTSAFFRIGHYKEPRRMKVTGKSQAIKKQIKDGMLSSPYPDVLSKIVSSGTGQLVKEFKQCANDMIKLGKNNDWGEQLDWSMIKPSTLRQAKASKAKSQASSKATREKLYGTWPKWYWDLTGPVSRIPMGELDLSTRKTVTPLLLRMQWDNYPLFHSKEHKWLFRVPKAAVSKDIDAALSKHKAVEFLPLSGDEIFAQDKDHCFFRLPHKDGEGVNVGNPLSKAFLSATESGILSSALANDPDKEIAQAASAAINMNALCSYWISSRERIMDQFVVYEDPAESSGMILPQVITMGTVTRRAVEATWLTASNAKKNRVGSELKAMVRSPPGYAIVGADVDSEELWLASIMGDSQFGCHGATAIGWMTLEGTKSAGTDLHSKTANILNITRDAAKVFNYSRIYGAGKPHAIQLLLQGAGNPTKDEADKLATNLYKATKGAKAFRQRKLAPANRAYLWHGGSESYLFNTLEAIALMDRPTTPALGCGVTRALRKSFLSENQSYLPSRINWVVQSSGVDYLHLLIVAMNYLIKRHGIKARYLISVHDEVRYLAEEDDKYRTALALQIANAWTRALFCYNLGIDDLPQGIAFFSAVDVDHILRKETDMPCVTPSQPIPLAPGESLDIEALLAKTQGNLGNVIRPDPLPRAEDQGQPVAIFADIRSPAHERFLLAQAATVSTGARAWLNAQPASPAAAAEQPIISPVDLGSALVAPPWSRPDTAAPRAAAWAPPNVEADSPVWTDSELAEAIATSLRFGSEGLQHDTRIPRPSSTRPRMAAVGK